MFWSARIETYAFPEFLVYSVATVFVSRAARCWFVPFNAGFLHFAPVSADQSMAQSWSRSRHATTRRARQQTSSRSPSLPALCGPWPWVTVAAVRPVRPAIRCMCKVLEAANWWCADRTAVGGFQRKGSVQFLAPGQRIPLLKRLRYRCSGTMRTRVSIMS